MEDFLYTDTKQSLIQKLAIKGKLKSVTEVFIQVWKFLKKYITNEFKTTIKNVYICPKCDGFLKNDGFWKVSNKNFLQEINEWRAKKIKRTKNGLILVKKRCPDCVKQGSI